MRAREEEGAIFEEKSSFPSSFTYFSSFLFFVMIIIIINELYGSYRFYYGVILISRILMDFNYEI